MNYYTLRYAFEELNVLKEDCESYHSREMLTDFFTPYLQEEMNEKNLKQALELLSPAYIHFLTTYLVRKGHFNAENYIREVYDQILDENVDKVEELYRQFKRSDYYYIDVSRKIYEKENFTRELLAIRFFDESKHNLNNMLRELENFMTSFESQLSKSEREKIKYLNKILNSICSPRNKDDQNFKRLYEKLKLRDKNFYTQLYYDCLQVAKKYVNQDIVTCQTPINSFPSTMKNGVKVINVKNQNFTFLISCLQIGKRSAHLVKAKAISIRDLLSLSLISKENKNTIRDMKKVIVLGYENVNPKAVAFVSEYDNYNYYQFNKSVYLSKERYCLCTGEEVLKRSKNLGTYNEINLMHKDSPNFKKFGKVDEEDFEIKPSYILCLNKIEDEEKELAKQINLPFVYIEDKHYKACGMASMRDKNTNDVFIEE